MDGAAPPPDRRQRRRERTLGEILDRAIDIMNQTGVAGLTMTQLAGAMQMQTPSLYKYYGSVGEVYDALFRRGQLANLAAVRLALASRPDDAAIDRLRAVLDVTGRWAIDNQMLAQLLFWRPIPHFAPSADAFEPTIELVTVLREILRDAARTGVIHPDAATDTGLDLLAAMHFGVISQQLANDPSGTWDDGRYSRWHPRLVAMFIAAFPPEGGGTSAPIPP